MRIENLTFGYDREKPVLSGFSYTFGKGKITAVIGPNGCGKSTLLGLCGKAYRPTDGAIYFDGKNIAEYGGRDFAKIAAGVYQINEIPPEITVRDFVAYGRTPHRGAFSALNAEDEAAIDYAVKKAGLEAFSGRRMSELSGGERQRAYLAIALAQRPKILFLDEPTTFLDVFYQLEIMDIVRNVNREEGVTVVMVLHDINQAVNYADDIIVMKNGRIAAAGSAKTTLTPELIESVFGVLAEPVETDGGGFYAVSRSEKPRVLAEDTRPVPNSGPAASGERRSLKKRVIDGILIGLGFLSLGVGAVGIVLPLLPSFPFFLLTLVCFAKGSRKFHRWFVATKIYKKYLEPFLKTRAMTNAAKVKVLIFITVLILAPIIFVDVLPMRIVLSAVILFHYVYFIFFVKSVSKKRLNEMLEEIRAKEAERREELP